MFKNVWVSAVVVAGLALGTMLSSDAAELGRSVPPTVNSTSGESGHTPATGLQLSFCAPVQIFPEEYDVSGLRLSLFYGRNRNLRGLDAGLINQVTGIAEGFQLGLANSAKDLSGLQVGGYNWAESTSGGFCQVGVVNISKDVSGVQIGLFNMCETMYGVQIGLLNFITQSDYVIFCPLINAQF